jgi:hypothetical protein
MITDRKPYDHTQHGSLVLVIIPIAVIVVAVAGVRLSGASVTPYVWASLLLAVGVVTASMLVFSRLRIQVRDGMIRWSFGWGFPGFSLPLDDVQTAAPIMNSWIFGLGIHLVPGGTLYNVWGRHAVEITRMNGRRIRLGTDEPEVLATAIMTNR